MKTLLMMSLTGGALALLVMLLRALLGHKLHPRMIYLLWLPVLLALVIPLRFESPISLRSTPAVQYVEQTVTARMDAPLTFTQPQTPDTSYISTDTSIAVGTSADGTLNVDIEETTRETTPARVTLDTWDILTIVWAVGALLTGGYIAVVNFRFRARVRRSRKPVDIPWIFARQMDGLPVYVSKVVPSPCLVGLVRPFIVVTPQAMEEETRLIHVLTHERMHLHQCDTLWSLLRMAVLTLHWFNPIVWIAASLSRADCENSCDALTIRTLGEEQRVDYGKTLLSFLRAKPTATALVNAATTMAQSRRQIRRRISLIAKKQRYAWLAAALAVTLTLTGCALTMTAPADDTSDPASVTETPAPIEQGSDAVEPTPTPVPAAAANAFANNPAIKDYVTLFETALQNHVKAFEDMDEAAMREIVPEFADYDLYGRRNADGDAYILVKLPQLQKEATYQEVWISTWQEEQNEFVVERNGTLDNGDLVRLEHYELDGLMIADTIEGIKDVLVLICDDSDSVLADLHTVSAARSEKYISSLYGATTIQPKQGAYLSVPLLSSETMQSTGWSTAITAYLPVEDDLLAGLEFTPIDQKRMKDFWEDTECMSMMRLHLDDKTSVYIGSDRLVMYEDHTPVSACVQSVYYERFNGIIEETFGIDPFFYIYSKAYQSPGQVDILSASLQMIDYQTGELLSAATTDGENLKKLKKLVFEPDDILVGGAGCPFGGILRLRTTAGEFTFHVATDSCGVLCYEGNVYIDYGDQTDLFEIFPACDPNAKHDAQKNLAVLEVLTAGAASWDIYEADAQVQELFDLILAKVESGDSSPADDIIEILYELDFRDATTMQLMKVEVGPGYFVYNDRAYPDKKREVLTLIDDLTE